MNVMTNFTLRSLKLNRKWTIVTIVGVIISTAMITAVASFCSSFMALMQNETIAETGNWHATFSNVSADKINSIRQAGFVKDVMLSRTVGYAQLNGSQDSHKPYIYIRQYDLESINNFHITLLSGRMPRSDSELAVSEAVKTDGGVNIKVGDRLTLQTGERISSDTGKTLTQSTPYESSGGESSGTSASEKFVAQSVKTYTVVGLIKQPTFESSWAPGYTAVTYLNGGALKSGETVDVSILAKHLSHNFFSTVKSFAKSIGISGSDVTVNDELLRYYGVVQKNSYQSTLYGFAAVLIAIIMAASVSLIYNAFAISVSERTRQLGMLASVGATKRQKSRHVYLEGFLIGLIGIPVGILTGIAGIGITFAVLRPIMNSFMNLSTAGLQLVVSPAAVIVAAVFAALTIFISAWIPARRASKITPIDAIRQSKEIRLTNRAVKTSPVTRAIFGFEGEIALKNLKRSRRKYRATVLSLVISLVLFLTVSFYVNYMNIAASATSYGVNYDFSVTYTGAPKSDTLKNIAGLPSVKDAVTLKEIYGRVPFTGAQLSSYTKKAVKADAAGRYDLLTFVYSMDGASFEKYARSLGLNPKSYEDPANPKVIVINYGQSVVGNTHAAGQVTNLKAGDVLNYESDGTDGKKFNMTVGALTEKRPMGILYQTFDHLAVITSDDACSSMEAAIKADGQPVYPTLYLASNDNAQLQKQLDNLTKNISKSQLYYENISALQQKENNVALVLGVFVYGFIILISLICIANIFNTISTNVALRRKEFAMLRSVGMTPKSFNKMLRYESVFYGLKALLYGIPISLAIQYLLYRLISSSLSLGFIIPWSSYAAAIALIFIVVFTTMLYSSSKIKKENIIDGLKEDSL